MDIVERLRDAEQWDANVPLKGAVLFGQAADEIEQLREERNRLRKALRHIRDNEERWWVYIEAALKEKE